METSKFSFLLGFNENLDNVMDNHNIVEIHNSLMWDWQYST